MNNRKQEAIREQNNIMRKNLKLLRKKSNRTIEELSQISAIDVKTLTGIENGQDFEVDCLFTLCRICRVKEHDIFSPL